MRITSNYSEMEYYTLPSGLGDLFQIRYCPYEDTYDGCSDVMPDMSQGAVTFLRFYKLPAVNPRNMLYYMDMSASTVDESGDSISKATRIWLNFTNTGGTQ